jgi:hypothetical protein
MYNLYYAAWGLSVAVLVCMVHALIRGRTDLVRGGAPLVFVFAILTIVFNAAR